MSRSKLHPTGTAAAATTTTIQAAAGVSALNDLLSDPYPTPSTSPSLAPTRKHQHQNPHFTPSPLSNTTTTTTTTPSLSPSASSYHTIAGAAAAHLIKQHQQQLQLQQQLQQQAIHDNARTLPAKLRGGSTITTAAAALNLQPSPALPPPSPRKNGTSRIGQSILGQLLAAHSPGRNKSSIGNDNALSSETHRPKEQQRRSILPAGWGLFSSSSSKSRTIHGPSLTTTTASKHSPSVVPASAATTGVTGAGVGGGSLLPSQLMENPEPTDHLQPVLPSVWLESILSGLPSSSRADLNNHTAPHYATLPRVNWQEDHKQQQQQGIFPGLGPRSKKDENNNRDRPPSGKSSRPPTSSTSTAPSPSLAPATLHPKARTLHRKSSVCELALGDDARELFQQNRPKTLSSAVISSSIVPAKESLRRRRSTLLQRSLDSSVALSSSSTTSSITKPVSEPSPKHRASAGSVVPSSSNGSNDSGSTTPIPVPATVKTTRGRFTIESSSALPSPSPRTRTLSCTSGMALPATGEPLTSFSPTLLPSSILAVGGSQQQQQEQQRMMIATAPRRMHTTPSIAMSPSSPTISRSFPSSRSLHSAASSSSSFPPSPRLSPSSTDHVDNNMSDINSSSNTTSSPISIPRASFSSSSSSAAAAANGSSNGGRSSHQRSQSSTSSLSRFSQVIIPPPASAASLQFASFSSIGSPSRSSAPSESSWATNNDNGHVHMRPSSVPEKRPTNSAGSNSSHGNNIRNLSIQIVEADRSGSRNSSRSSTRRVLHDYEGEPTPVHPLDEDLATFASASASATTARTHQTMNRVHPTQDQDFVDSPGGSEGSSSLGSRVGSISGGSNGMFMAVPDRRASENVHQQQYSEGGGFGYFDRTSPGSFRPRSLSATNLDSSFGGGYGKNGSSPSLHQQLSWADRTAMRREGSAHSRSFDVGPGSGTPPTSYLSPHTHNGSGSSTPTPESDIVMVKKSAKGRMFTVERQSTLPLPSSPTRSSRFIVVSSTEDMCLSSAGSGSGALTLSPPHHSLH